MTPLTPQLLARLVLLGVVGGIIQVAVVSQIELFGTNADLAPLVVMAVGLLAGSLYGACFGFAVGLLVDLALVQTVGLSSLMLVGVGYGAGRLRELRDPHGALVAPLAGAAATTLATLGYSMMQFLLGVDAPVGLTLAREILATVLLNTLIAGPVYAVVRRWLSPSLPDNNQRRRRRRAYTTGGLSPLTRS